MRENSESGGTPEYGRAAGKERPFATFKLPAPHIEMVQGRALAVQRREHANINRLALVTEPLTQRER